MRDQDLMALWKTQDQKIEKIMAMNAILLHEQISQKAKKTLGGLKAEKITGIVFGIPYVILLGTVFGFGLYGSGLSGNYFLISIGGIFLVNVKVLADYIRHLILSYQIDFSGTVTAIQTQLIELRLSLIRSVRYIGFQLPFYSTFHLDSSWFPSQATTAGILIQILITGLFTSAAIWIFLNFKSENTENRIVKKLLFIAGIKEVDQSLAQLEEIKTLSK